MKKKTYAKPTLISEEFIPNAYCNICWEIECTVNGKDSTGMMHSSDTGCGDPHNQYITGENGKWTFKEINSDQGADLVTENISQIPNEPYAGAPITWITRNIKDNRKWYHSGVIVNCSRPNHS